MWISRRRHSSASGSPSYAIYILFASGQQGEWDEPNSALGGWTQDAAGMTPISAIGQSIGRALDKSGRANYLIQAAAGERPILAQNINFANAKNFDGVNDSLTSTAGGGGTAGFFWCSAIKPAGGAGTNRTIWSDAGVNTGYRVRINAADQFEFAAGDGLAYTLVVAGPVDVGMAYVVMAWDDGVNLNIQINENAVVSVARPVVAAGTASFTIGKDNGLATNFFPGDIYAEVYRAESGLIASQRESVKRYVTQESRVTLLMNGAFLMDGSQTMDGSV